MHPVHEIRVLIEKGRLFENLRWLEQAWVAGSSLFLLVIFLFFCYVEVQSILRCTIKSSLPNLRTKHGWVHTLVWCYFQELVWINISVCSKISCLTSSLTLIVGSQIGTLEELRKQFLRGIVGVQRYFRGGQARRNFHELKQGVMILQSCSAPFLIFFSMSHLRFLTFAL